MEAPEVPVGSLIDFGPEAPTSSPLEAPPPALQDGDGSLGDGASESETTESADSENDMGESPSHPSWDQDRRSSSNESFSSSQSTESTQDEETLALRDFMRGYVEKIFSGGEDLDQEEKAKFGEYCSSENGKGREWFARYVSAQILTGTRVRCLSDVERSFAVNLASCFRCHQMDDFGPAKNLMTMCFTYYHIGKPQLLPPESREKPTGGIDSYLKSANSWLAEKKDIAERLLKNTSARTENVKGFFGGLETKLKGPLARRNEEDENKPQEKRPRAVTVYSPEDEKKGEKIYLYTHLKQQPIWHTLRFWNAAFFDAVHCERTKRSPTTRGDAGEEEEKREKWCHMTQEERDDSLRFNENITFGQLGTFSHNMLAFGLNKKLCNDFLKKQAVIGNLDEEQYKLLSDHIEQMATE
uniref:KIAA0513 n=1 Tax=Rhinopithecus roxellana TaxID=61622 RepID=A0A2K6RAR4_RHIRO